MTRPDTEARTRKIDRLLAVALLTLLASTAGLADGVAQERVANSHPAFATFQSARQTQLDVKAIRLQLESSVVPEDLAILLDDAQRNFDSPLGLVLQDALTMGADLPPSRKINSLTDGQRRDALNVTLSIEEASRLADQEVELAWQNLPTGLQRLIERARALQIGGALGLLVSGLITMLCYTTRQKQLYLSAKKREG